MMRTSPDMKRSQGGFTIVEIMVALVVSMLMLIGIIEIFSGNRETYRLQTGMANLQENARMAMDVLRHDISMAGSPTGTVPFPFDSARSTSTSIAPIFQTDTDCFGATLAANTLRTHVYSVAQVNGTWSLLCATDVDFNDARPVVDGVEAVRFLYGLNDATNRTYRYVAASAIATPADWKNVVTVRVALLINTVDPVVRGNNPNNNQVYYLLDAPALAYNDTMRRNVYSFTVSVPNSFGQNTHFF